MDFSKKFEVDTNKVDNGVWITVDTDGAQIQIKRYNNTAYQKLVQAKVRDRMRELKTTVLDDTVYEEITMEAAAEAVLIGWRGITANDVEVPYSPAQALEYFKKGPDFYLLVLSQAQKLDNFLVEHGKSIEKNS